MGRESAYDGPGILFYLALIVPGAVFISVRAQFRGFSDVDRSVGARILLAFVISAAFDAICVAAFGRLVVHRLNTGAYLTEPEVATLGWLFVGWLSLSPQSCRGSSMVAALCSVPSNGVTAKLRDSITDSCYESTPTAWDLVTTTTKAGGVRVRLGDGVWVGGRFPDNSYFSTYPEPRGRFIQEQYVMTEGGKFGEPVPSTGGVWIAVRDHYLSEWVYDTEGAGNDASQR